MRGIFSLLMLVWINSFAQSPNVHGTIILAAIAKDGIILVGDSRVMIGDPNYNNVDKPTIYGYYDNEQKVHINNGFGLGIAGAEAYQNLYIPTVLSRFNELKLSSNSPLELLNNFINFVSNKYKDGRKVFSSALIAAQYSRVPQICKIQSGNITDTIKNSGWVCSTILLKESKLFNYDKNLSCEALAKRAETAMKKLIENNHYEGMMGGLFTVIKITKNNHASFIKNDLRKLSHSQFCDVANDIVNNKIKLVYIGKDSKTITDAYIMGLRNHFCQ